MTHRLRDLTAHLAQKIEGEVRFDAGSRALYATDASHYRQVPIGVVLPKTKGDLIEAVRLCAAYDVPVLARGGGTSLAGQACNEAVVLDTSKYYHRILELRPMEKVARFEPGLVLDDLLRETRKHGLIFGPDPSTHSRCTLGGMIGNDACGVHSLMAGRTVANVLELEILTYDGCLLRVGPRGAMEKGAGPPAQDRASQIIRDLQALRDRYAENIRSRFPKIPRRVSGYGLDWLLPENGFDLPKSLVGTEGTCVVLLEATVKLVPDPPSRCLLVLGFSDIATAGDAVPEILSYHPVGLEAFDGLMVENMRLKNIHLPEIRMLPAGGSWLLVEFAGGDRGEAGRQAGACESAIRKWSRSPSITRVDDALGQRRLWSIREFGPAATVFVPGKEDAWSGWEDSAVAPQKLGAYLRDLLRLYKKHGYEGALYGHFGDGCVHSRINFDFKTTEGVRKYRAFVEEAADLVVRHGGSLSGEHGDGQARGELLSKMYGAELVEAFREFKAIWDPRGRMNPGKVVDPYPLDRNLRWPLETSPKEPATHFQFPEDGGSFWKATSRCVGIGKCRQREGGTMCPSYRVTLEEKHTTRGRAHLLAEMLQGDVLREGWRDRAVKDALDLCLACKACKSECPTQVDLATYKAEFLAHYYENRMRPRSAYAFGWVDRWAYVASKAPWLANFLAQRAPFKAMIQALTGMAPERKIPVFASSTFRHWFSRHLAPLPEAPEVVLWPDTFHNYFHPAVLIAATNLLERAGFRVILPEGPLCCGRPLYDYGMLASAKEALKKVLRALGAVIRRGVPVVGLEPSCVSVFRDELGNLLALDEMAVRLSKQTFFLAEFLERHAKHSLFSTLKGKALVQGHCHQQALKGLDSEMSLLAKVGLEASILDAGCCGMAGGFGFERDHYAISVAIAENALLPKLRGAGPDTLLIADGFSCREQIAQQAGLRSVHLAQVLAMALKKD